MLLKDQQTWISTSVLQAGAAYIFGPTTSSDTPFMPSLPHLRTGREHTGWKSVIDEAGTFGRVAASLPSSSTVRQRYAFETAGTPHEDQRTSDEWHGSPSRLQHDAGDEYRLPRIRAIERPRTAKLLELVVCGAVWKDEQLGVTLHEPVSNIGTFQVCKRDKTRCGKHFEG